MEAYRTIQGTAEGEYEDRKSRFLAFAAHVETEQDALDFLAKVKAAHPMARHHVYAYVLRAGNRVRYSDDGEPRRTAGIPVLEVINHHDLKDVICVVVRYFGGTLLGTGGLVRAYTKAPQRALEQAKQVQLAPCCDVVASVSYPWYETLARFADERGLGIVDTTFASDVTVQIRVPSDRVSETTRALEDLTNGDVELLVGEEELALAGVPSTAAPEA